LKKMLEDLIDSS